MNRKKPVLILSCLLVVIVGALAIFLVVSSNKDTNKEKYNKKISAANKYVQEERWDDAIGAYLEAIEYNDEDENAYYTLAQIYIYKNMMDDAKNTLLKGIEKTNSQRLQDMYNQYFLASSIVDTDAQGEKDAVEGLEINTPLLKNISNYKLSDYIAKYGSPSYNVQSTYCEVVHKNLSGVTFTYYNTDDNDKIIDSSTEKPNETAMPWEVKVDNLTTLFTGSGEKILYSDLEKLNLKGLRTTRDNTQGFEIVTFESSNCTVNIQCDDNGDIELNAWNEILPNEANTDNEDSGDKFKVEGMIVSATTGNGISRVKIYVRDRGEQSGNPIAETETDSNGKYTLDLETGEYTAEIDTDGFMTEFVDFEVDKWGDSDIKQVTISETLKDGEIRVVLEWGEYPRDLDSHLEGTTSAGDRIHVYYVNKYTEAANLDVDDTTSYGPETITITDINGNYEYYVYDFTQSGNIGSSGATVKVYLPGESSPRIYEVPAITGNTWRVFTLVDGEIIDSTN